MNLPRYNEQNAENADHQQDNDDTLGRLEIHRFSKPESAKERQ